MALVETKNLLEVQGIRQSFRKAGGGELSVLEDVNLSLREGEIVGLLGRSGSGKSTLLRLIAGSARRPAAISSITARRSTAPPRASPWCSRASRSFRGSPCWRTSSSGWRRSACPSARCASRRSPPST